ncbi:uroporphyrinogen-III synthase [Ochromonadaceae sp. CCMP2298]|nr:uroporphyrinogen-III synthase [Ochromonadaceae sp. CCMP2298]
MSLKVGLTRELGANGKLLGLLEDEVECFEVPCIMFDTGDDIDKLEAAIPAHDIITITSPQAADVFLNVWMAIGKPAVKVVTVGKGTSKPLIAAGIKPVFEPSDATAVTLARELPAELGTSVLYPSSALADNKLVGGLAERGFKVTRLNTYTTVSAVPSWTPEQLTLAKSMDIVTFASPSAIKNWVSAVGVGAKAVVIGPTSRDAAEKAGFTQVYCPAEDSKGLEPWALLIREIALGF